MRQNIIYLLLTASLIVCGSCEDFLEVDLLTEKTESSFYQSKEDAYLALVGAYDGLQRAWSGGVSFPVASSVFSDNCFGGTGATDGYGYQMMDEFSKERSPSDLNIFEPMWKDYYKAIFRCNKLLLNLDNIEWEGDVKLRSQYEAETRFIRAFCYFDLVRLFGNIPLMETPSKDNVPQADPVEVYKLIASDLQYASDSLSADPWSAGWAAENDGRVTRWAAESLLGRVFLYYTGYYSATTLPTKDGEITAAQALSYLEEVVAQSGHALLDTFAHLWPAASVDKYAGEGNKETVFSIKYTYTSDYDGNTDGNHWMVMYGIRQLSSYPYGQGWGGATVTKDLWDQYSADDTRRSASVISAADEALDVEPEYQREYTGYYIKKYSPMSTEDGQSLAESLGGVSFQIGQFQDFVSIRFADVLLMAAELGSTNAQEYFDRVRKRALGGEYVQIPLTEENLRRERRLELAFEGIRYWDLLRYGVSTAAAEINVSGVQVQNGGNAVEKSITFNTASMGLQQIPYNQITLSDGVLKQNEGW